MLANKIVAAISSVVSLQLQLYSIFSLLQIYRLLVESDIEIRRSLQAVETVYKYTVQQECFASLLKAWHTKCLVNRFASFLNYGTLRKLFREIIMDSS